LVAVKEYNFDVQTSELQVFGSTSREQYIVKSLIQPFQTIRPPRARL